ncbi:hypothetical protein SARC_06681 [Sphaeroforma arctica JP610]|uniref:Uncharacterized protein n=1 Tax=Sphaeroforma arctica JP610 TaxID=667725 RepID=A0A0L0FWF7_9EUKA|nr:hypothetical protein SARC_06681 [Sphaeroforma arctica JP610]KNC80979.1 hypothetical protein SARC_06681 [Sphaeroforma arctica JP610]|eukprot:XP_014154881.1 hypothetical protein SARC_06681 [Sphaeroforma arctica JP610]
MGKADVLVNNAGFSNNNVKTKICDETIENFDLLIVINVRAPFILCREAMKDMTSRGEGHILNVVSTVALTKQENFGVYSASKYALDGLTGSLAKEGRKAGVKVTAAYPGGTGRALPSLVLSDIYRSADYCNDFRRH